MSEVVSEVVSEIIENPPVSFADLTLSEPLLRSLHDIGYEYPSPIQAATIPTLLGGRDVLGQAQTGTGKTAAFALPILSNIDMAQTAPQALVLAPTRELAIQVAEAFQTYAKHMPNFHVLPIYGGQSYGPQLSALRRGVHVVVGTPGRVIDHLDKGSLDLSQLKTLVLDEADEMLRMGFIDDVERILKETPPTRQTALFSATMPAAIKRIAQTYLNKPEMVTIAAKTGTADNIRQRYWLVSGMHKLDALTRILEAETFDGMIIFARTKLGTEELAAKLSARGFSVAAINGDVQQQQRERTIQQLKDGKIDILVATDVAARGLDVERISHVVNYDVPHDPESYTHRIGRTGRAGRSGEAILFITPREKHLLKVIERATRQPVSPLELPTVQDVNNVRITRFKTQISDVLAEGGLEEFASLIEDYEREHNVPAIEIAAALAKMARGNSSLLLSKKSHPVFEEREVRSDVRFERQREAAPQREYKPRSANAGAQTYRIAVGHEHGVKPGNIVGAIANEANIESRYIGRIDIRDEYTLLDLPSDLSPETIEHLRGVRVAGQMLNIQADGQSMPPAPRGPRRERSEYTERAERHERNESFERKARVERTEQQPVRAEFADRLDRPERAERAKANPSKYTMHTYRIDIGGADAVTKSGIVEAIANGAGLQAKLIGRIQLLDGHSNIDLPEGMPEDVLNRLKTVQIDGKSLNMRYVGLSDAGENRPKDETERKKKSTKKK
ncbi:ATP-dependent RNA helicase DeaD [Ephemeroptericola cinctiostellae]|uniref:ATP-dependent RNA helicase DeaD n=1 Tax=Ephemeroptericola cinctiostellae TaxID=2268024 RepID=A0A345DAR6_9BURK|nr:DEAD/DEAH box helicase [Ephemeroptericola cinctiostellae]AXF85454.1 ATP-dependent RNA helicase DeaD [Ephemeroptericola cinctiostellae]